MNNDAKAFLAIISMIAIIIVIGFSMQFFYGNWDCVEYACDKSKGCACVDSHCLEWKYDTMNIKYECKIWDEYFTNRMELMG